ncbi:MAG TPA: hypothetical protein VLU46_16400 [Thermoanaerobaculia bacterium]|nr:hypothetical protein [Thermoanaerobaculia bacterium]
MTHASALRKPVPLFSIGAATIAIACVAITRTHAFAQHPDVLAWSVTFDLTLTIPLLYYLFVVRTGAARAITIAPVFAIGAAVAAISLPRGDQQFLHELRFLVVPVEIVTIVLVVQRLRRGESPNHPALAFVATELAILRYAFAGWHRRADVPEGAQPFTVHERSGWGSVVFAFVVIIAAESIAAHLLIQMWSAKAAWLMTAFDIYGALWLLGDYNALRLRPSFLAGDTLHVRYGLRWSVSVPLDRIASCDPIREEAEWKRPGVLKVAMLDAPRFLVRLREPVVAHGIAGLRKTIDAIAVLPDDDSVFTGGRLASGPAEPAPADRR